MEELGRRFDAARPEAVIVLTPHNVHVEGSMAVVAAGFVAGALSDTTQAGETARSVGLRSPTDRELAVACLEDRRQRVYYGAAPVEGEPVQAVVSATLDALNRSFGRLKPRERIEYELRPTSLEV